MRDELAVFNGIKNDIPCAYPDLYFDRFVLAHFIPHRAYSLRSYGDQLSIARECSSLEPHCPGRGPQRMLRGVLRCSCSLVSDEQTNDKDSFTMMIRLGDTVLIFYKRQLQDYIAALP